jgi:hypothetical protein
MAGTKLWAWVFGYVSFAQSKGIFWRATTTTRKVTVMKFMSIKAKVQSSMFGNGGLDPV